MAKVKNVSLTEQLTEDARISNPNGAKEVTIKDKLGRTITVRKPNLLIRAHFYEAIGAEAAKNNLYVNLFMVLTWIKAIDGDAIPPLRTKAQVDALIQRLDDEGFEAANEGFYNLLGVSLDEPQLIEKNANEEVESQKVAAKK